MFTHKEDGIPRDFIDMEEKQILNEKRNELERLSSGSYAFKLLLQEMMSLGLAPCLKLKEKI